MDQKRSSAYFINNSMPMLENTINNYRTLFIGSLASVMLLVTTLLIVEYRYFKQQAEKMIILKEEYKNYLFAVKKIVDEYNKLKEEEDTQTQEVEKKKEDELKDAFVVVNREPNYLKQSMIDFMKEQGHETVLKRINFDDWRDYNEQLLENTTRSVQPKKFKTKKTASKSSYKRFLKGSIKQDIDLVWPIEKNKFWLSSLFGPRKKPNGSWGFHYGIDMAAIKGTPVKAAYSGTVIEAKFSKGFGKTIVINHNHKYKTRYAHLSEISVTVGQRINKGEVIGKVGDTGLVRSKFGRDPSHLHFEVYVFGRRKNPMYFFM